MKELTAYPGTITADMAEALELSADNEERVHVRIVGEMTASEAMDEFELAWERGHATGELAADYYQVTTGDFPEIFASGPGFEARIRFSGVAP